MCILRVRDLHTVFETPYGKINAVNGVSFDLNEGSVLGIVGESGSGKSVTAYSIMQILTPPGRIESGSIMLGDTELVGLGEDKMSKIRGNRISMIFQDPMTSLNPVYTIGNQLTEALLLHTHRSREDAKKRAAELLELVGVNEPQKRLTQYPHQFSGGMRQRVMIAMALACEPDILIADEPTTALDVTIQAQILELMQELQKQLHMSIILITHDLGVVAGMCDEVIVMYAGQICERGSVDDIFYRPEHRYTVGLLRSVPSPQDRGGLLLPIEGSAVDLLALPRGCPFAPRCDKAMKICLDINPGELILSGSHTARCWYSALKQLRSGSINKEQLEEMYSDGL